MAQNIETREQLIGQVSLATQKVVDLEALASRPGPTGRHGRRKNSSDPDLIRDLGLARRYLQDLKDELEKSSGLAETVPCP